MKQIKELCSQFASGELKYNDFYTKIEAIGGKLKSLVNFHSEFIIQIEYKGKVKTYNY